MVKHLVIALCLLLSSCDSGSSGAMGSTGAEGDWLIGRWELVSVDDDVTLTNFADGRYRFERESTSGNYLEEGSYVLVGDTLTQRWLDPQTGQQEVTYTVERLSDMSFRESGGNLGDSVFTFLRVTDDPESPGEVGGGTVSAGPPTGAYSCYTLDLALNYYTGGFYPTPVPFDTLTLLDGGRYSSEIVAGTGTYDFDPASGRLSYTSGPYADAGYHATFDPSQQSASGASRFVMTRDSDSSGVPVYCDGG